MLLAIMEHMAALAERFQIERVIVRRVVIEMGRGQRHSRAPELRLRARNSLELSTSSSAPGALCLVPPAPVTQVLHELAMRTTALLASGLRSVEPDDGREFAPVDRVEPAELRADGHEWIMLSHLAGASHPPAGTQSD
jgi:hypothetical protein